MCLLRLQDALGTVFVTFRGQRTPFSPIENPLQNCSSIKNQPFWRPHGILRGTATTTRIEHILGWGRERLQAVRRRRAPKLEAGFYRCQGWAGCIIATIWQPELLSQESLVEVEDELRVRCALKPALCPLRSHNEPFRKEDACQNDHQVDTQSHFSLGWNFGDPQLRFAIWR